MSYGPASPPTNHGPHSPLPKMFGQPPQGPSGGPPKASDVMKTEDYKNLRFSTTVNGMFSGFAGGGVLTYLVYQFAPKRPTKNALSLIFLLSSTGISFLTSKQMLNTQIGSFREKAHEMSAHSLSTSTQTDPDTPQSADVVNSPNEKYLAKAGQLDWGAGGLGSGQVLDEGFVGEDRGGASSWGAGAGK